MTAQGLTYYAQDGLIRHAFGPGYTFTPPSALYVAAFTSFPTIGGGGTEATGTRAEILSHLDFAGTGTGRAETVDDVTISGLTNGDTIVGLATFTASTAGTMVTFGALTTPRLITAGELVLPAGSFHVAFQAGTEQNFTHYTQDKMINHLFSGNVAFTEWDTFSDDNWLAAFASAPTVSGGGTEASGYTRQPTLSDMEHAGTNTGRVRNANSIAFTDLPDDDYTHIGLFDDETGGNLYLFAQLRPAVSTTGGSIVFDVGNLIFGFP